ncbi:hypothetical protein ES754_08775 [Psychrobacter frigidicola]|uniref:Abortive infection protein-like C-terminal domain-containing protein n=1 Tax=Psychrobacter frigidicola TaxID=45611 RepID=A0A5C7A3C7_9GAMM|nr:hypothetical protein [Psychrobacter frigidicola]TXD97092.1 hypothetical protein ES754_08775 [Psychrobacter frigidicola]
MAIVDLFHKRQKRLRGEYPDIYQYEELPRKLKVQIVHLWNETIDRDKRKSQFQSASLNRPYLEKCYRVLCKELGVFELNKTDNENRHLSSDNYFDKIAQYFINESDTEKSLSIIEVMAQITEGFSHNHLNEVGIDIADMLSELNQRFREHGVGYQYENSQIVRVDSEFIHAEAVKPALQLLSNPMYKGAQEEFLKAHEHYRHGRYSEALIECLKAYESTLKIILSKNNWDYSSNATADELTGRIMQSGLVDDFWQQHFKSLKNTLTAGVPTARNKLAGHGAANEVREIPEYLVSYILHMTASTIVFLVKADEALV